jgi:hypothetical protein
MGGLHAMHFQPSLVNPVRYRVLCWQAFPALLLYMGKAKSLPLSGAPERQVSLTLKH